MLRHELRSEDHGVHAVTGRVPGNGARGGTAVPALAIGLMVLAAAVPSAAARDARQEGRELVQVLPAGDLDADGRADVISLQREPPFVEGSVARVTGPTVVAAWRGADGSVLWERQVPAELVVPAAVGPAGDPGVLAVEGPVAPDASESFARRHADGIGIGFATSRRTQPLSLTALSTGGGVAWTRSFDPAPFGAVFAFLPGQGTEVVATYRRPIFAGTLQATPSPAEEVLVSVITRVEAGGEIRSRTEVLVLEGRDGSVVTGLQIEAEGTVPTTRPVADLDGDGLDDFVVLREASPNGLTARRGVDGAALWSNPGLVPAFRFTVRSVGDVSGDGIADLAVGGLDGPGDDVPQQALLDGATGTHAFTAAGETLGAVGDITGDGRRELISQLTRQRENAVEVLYQLFEPTGRPIASRHFLHDPPATGEAVAARLFPTAGDLDRDGALDAAHELTFRPREGDVRRLGVAASGRTLEPVFEGEAGLPLFASLDGRGDDLALLARGTRGTLLATAQDGATGAALWRRHLPVDEGWRLVLTDAFSGGDVDGDGVADVLLSARLQSEPSSLTELRAWILGGTDGALLWTV